MTGFKIAHTAVSALIGVAMLALSGAAAAKTVHCHDPDRDTVSQKRQGACQGRIVSKDEAAAIAERRAEYIRRAVNSPPPPRPDGVGSGFFVSSQGDVLTNRHVVEKCARISVLIPDGETVPAMLVSVSKRYDMALLRTTARPKVPAIIAADRLTEGDRITISGFPVRKLPRIQPLDMKGLYLGRYKRGGPEGMLVLAATVWRGASGSPVVAENGRVSGMVFARNNSLPRPDAPTGRATPIPPDRTFAIPGGAMLSFLNDRGIKPARPAAGALSPAGFAVRVDCHS